jgi:ABC-type lipoprotein export system ATPase subunit
MEAAMSDAPAISTRDLWRIYRTRAGIETPALQGVTLELPPGRFYALKGRSGSGKTTLLNIVGGLDNSTRGEVSVFGRALASLGVEARVAWRRAQVGFIFQSFGLIPILSACENVELVMRISGIPRRGRARRAAEALEQVGLGQWQQHRPYELSGGQQQRVAIARAMVHEPRLLIADEPTGELDTATAHEVLTLFRDIVRQKGVTLLMATHDSRVDGYADQVINLADGKIAA